jgi:hypothetical protein
MMYVYIKGNKICLEPADPGSEPEAEEILQILRKHGIEAMDIETKYRPDEQMQRYGYRQPQGQKSFGFNSPQGYMPMPPDFNPMSHYSIPLVWPLWFGQGGGSGGDGGGSGGGSRGYRDGGYRNEQYDRGYRSERGGEYDGRENPRDTGRGDTPRR